MSQTAKTGFLECMTYFLLPSYSVLPRGKCANVLSRGKCAKWGRVATPTIIWLCIFRGLDKYHLSKYQVSTSVSNSPFGLHPRFVRHPFSFHELLHGIGVDYWTDRVSFVGPRVLLFHCLLTSAEWEKKPHLSHCWQKRWAGCFHRRIPSTDSGHVYQMQPIWIMRLPFR